MTQTRNETNDPFTHLHEEVSKIFKKYNIDSTKCDALEEILLKIADIDEEPKGGRWTDYDKVGMDYVVFTYAISKSSADAFISYLNDKYPEIQAKDITNIALSKDIETDIDGRPAIIIQMNAAAVEKNLLPLFSNYLEENPKLAQHYEGLSYTFDKLIKDAQALFLKQGIKETSGCLEETLWHIIKTGAIEAQGLKEGLPDMPPVLLDIIGDYADARPYTAQEIQDVDILSIHLEKNREDAYLTDVDLIFKGPATAEPQNALSRYFNKLVPNSSKDTSITDDNSTADEKEKKASSTQIKTVTVQNKAFMHPALTTSLTHKLESYSLDELDLFRKKSKTIKKTTKESMLELKKAHRIIKDNKDYCEFKSTASFLESIHKFIDYVEHNDLRNLTNNAEDFKKLYDKTRTDLVALWNENKAKVASKSHLPPFFTRAAPLSELLLGMNDAVNEIYKIGLIPTVKQTP